MILFSFTFPILVLVLLSYWLERAGAVVTVALPPT
jgi:hypothetical protein